MATSEGINDVICGGITNIASNSVEIENLGRFAVDQYNEKQNKMLQFVKVSNAKQQLVAGYMYYLTLEALDGDKKKVYEAKVWQKIMNQGKELTEFKEAGEAAASS
ncbi:Cysteine proteinase inhibitor [Melia azedarach]|uniref:Cysteine proteinase inhibitor n=1 Tax=Melia azedarach TaxID=155640 RepID=A0ACC1YL51_MELAZ|nr:Cysteine proteinase inhibitor [Melia azedarach]